MDDATIRRRVAEEAARLIFRGKESDFTAARKRAARWMSQRRLSSSRLPSNAEIQVELEALGGVFSAERDAGLLIQMRERALHLMTALDAFSPRCHGAVVTELTTPGSPVELIVVSEGADGVLARLRTLGLKPPRRIQLLDDDSGPGVRWMCECRDEFPVVIRGVAATFDSSSSPEQFWSHDRLQAALEQSISRLERDADSEDSVPFDDNHPDAFALMRLLLEPLARIRLNPQQHPEGDALYHSLQVFDLGGRLREYDEEFLLACLLHETGLAINPKHAVLAAIDALGPLITARTRFLIEHLDDAAVYLRTGRASGQLKRHPDFDALLDLARCDRAGRVPGAACSTLDEAFARLETLRAECTGDDATDELDSALSDDDQAE